MITMKSEVKFVVMCAVYRWLVEKDGVPSDHSRPSARKISNNLLNQYKETPTASGVNMLWVSFGQFIDHDVALSLAYGPDHPLHKTYDIPVRPGTYPHVCWLPDGLIIQMSKELLSAATTLAIISAHICHSTTANFHSIWSTSLWCCSVIHFKIDPPQMITTFSKRRMMLTARMSTYTMEDTRNLNKSKKFQPKKEGMRKLAQFVNTTQSSSFDHRSTFTKGNQ